MSGRGGLVVRVVVLGATGEMGRRVVRWLRKRCPEAEIVGVCRSGRGDSQVPLRAADVHAPESLAPLLDGGGDGGGVVVNVVGPYRWDPDALIAACVAARCHYVDLAEDPDFLAAVVTGAATHDAAGAGVAVVAGASTAPGLGELMARHVSTPDTAEVRAWLSMGSRNPVSRGLLVGLLRPLGRPRPEGGRWFRGVETRRVGDRNLRFAPYPWPEPSVDLGTRRVPLRFHVGFDRAFVTHGLSLGGRVLGRLSEARVESLAPFLLPLVSAARPLGTPLGALVVAGFDAQGREGRRVEVHADRDGLDIPALPAAWAVRAICAGADVSGACRLADCIAPADAFRDLREAGYRVVE